MALVFCKACGKQISANAKNCPACGEPQKSTNKGLILFVIAILIIGGLCFAGYMFLNAPSTGTEAEQKKAIITEILGRDCRFVSQASAEFINRPMVAAIIATIISNRCDCVQDVIVPKMMEKYSLEELEEMKIQPIQGRRKVADVIMENAGEIQERCLQIN